ncbi:MAG: response regulator [Myxococcota bacterium]|nr:response regulator [Myxococcota bacterium]
MSPISQSNEHLLLLARRLQRVSNFQELADIAAQAMAEHTRYRASWLTLFDLDREMAQFLAGHAEGGRESVEAMEMVEFSIQGDRMVEEILRSRAPVIVEDAPLDPRPNQEAVAAMGSRTIINVPLLFDDRSLGCYGTGTFGEMGPMLPTDEELAFLNGMASQMSVVIARLRAEQRRRDVETQLLRAQRMEAMGLLAGGVAHDFNNLLTAVLGNLDLARMSLPDDSPAQEFLEGIEEAAGRGASLSRQLLAFSRSQAVQPRPLDLNDVLAGMDRLLQRLLPKSIRIEYLPGKQLGTVMADPGQLEQVVLNLAINARDAMPEGGRLVLETENVLIDSDYRSTHPWARLGRFVLLSVTDSGVGMPPKVVEKVFEPFFTTKGERGGTGLGLAVVFGVVEQHRGMVRVYSEPGVGTSFKVYLPIVQRAATSVGSKIERPIRGGDEHILLAEDDIRVRRVVRSMLAQEGYQVSVAGDGKEALALCESSERPVDLVLSDLVMPEMDGARLFKALRERFPSLPVVIMSGYAANGLASRFDDDDELRILTKPFRSRDLLRAVREALDLSPRP